MTTPAGVTSVQVCIFFKNWEAGRGGAGCITVNFNHHPTNQISDRNTYEEALALLMPDVFQRLSPHYVKVVRSFAKHLEGWMSKVGLAICGAGSGGRLKI